MIDERILMGYPLFFKNICKVYPPTLNDVLGEKDYGLYFKILTLSQEDIWDSLAEKEGDIPKGAPTPFDQLMSGIKSSPDLAKKAKEAFEFFTKEEVQIREEGEVILFTEGIEEVTDINSLRLITEDNFFDFQNLIREVTGRDQLEAPIEDEHPRVAIIKARARKRDRLVQKKGNQSSISLSQLLVALSCMNVGFALLKEHGEMSYPAIFELFNMARNREKHQVDMQLIAGGADAKKIRPKDWIRNTN